MFLINSCLGLFSATISLWHPFSRTYGVNLPSSLTTLLPLVLGFSPHLPVSVCGTGAFTLDSGFSRQCGIGHFGTLFSLRITPPKHPADFPTRLSTSLARTLPAARLTYPPASPPLLSSDGSTGISTCCPSTTPSGLALGPDLPWADEPSPGNLRFSTVKILTLLSLLIPAFSLLFRPHVLSIMLRPTTVSSPTPRVCSLLSLNFSLALVTFGEKLLFQFSIAAFRKNLPLDFSSVKITPVNTHKAIASVHSLAPNIFGAGSLD